MRFRLSMLHRVLVGTGNRDAHYQEAQAEICWHHHFTREELMELAGEGWEMEACRYGGLVLFPLTDIASWPLYRLGRTENWFARGLGKIADFEIGISFGRRSYGILLVLGKSGSAGKGVAGPPAN